ncbi:MAG: type II secretion system F family protein [Sedimentisphaerales bacterium]|nr:type II secretion system F family protein [Sedimentisphaerales bacterium]
MMIIIALILLALDGYLATKKPWLALLFSAPIIIGLFIWGVYYEDAASMAISISTLLAVILTCILFAIISLAKRSLKKVDEKTLTPLIHFAPISKRNTTLTVLSTISAAMRQNLPLSEALYAAGEREDAPGRILRDIAYWLSQGYSLSDALRQGYPRCPSDALALITLAERVNQTPLALKSIEADLLVKTDRFHRVEPVHPVYPLIVLSVGFCIVMGIMIFVIPKFRSIFEDFSIKMPAATENLVGFSSWFVYKCYWLPWTFLLILAICVGTYIYTRFQPRQPRYLSFLSRLGDWIKWHLPVTHWYELNYSLLRTTAALRLCLNAGTTVDNAIAYAIDADVNYCFRPRLRRWLAQVRQGGDTAHSARTNRMGAPLAWAFDDNVNRGNTPYILGQLEGMYRHAYSYWVSIARCVFWPLCILALALVMGTIVYSLFTPIVALIQGTLDCCMM